MPVVVLGAKRASTYTTFLHMQAHVPIEYADAFCLSGKFSSPVKLDVYGHHDSIRPGAEGNTSIQ